jgi:hypothetical protein
MSDDEELALEMEHLLGPTAWFAFAYEGEEVTDRRHLIKDGLLWRHDYTGTYIGLIDRILFFRDQFDSSPSHIEVLEQHIHLTAGVEVQLSLTDEPPHARRT